MILLKESNENQCINFIPRRDSEYFLVQLKDEESKELIYSRVLTSALESISQVCDVFNVVSGVTYELSIYTTDSIESLEFVDANLLDLEVAYLDKVLCVQEEEEKYKTFNDNEKKYKTI